MRMMRWAEDFFKPCHRFVEMFCYLTLPNDNDSKAHFFQIFNVLFIICNIPIKLVLPKISMRLRCCGIFASGVAMPKASLNKNYCVICAKDNIRFSWKMGFFATDNH